MLTLSACISAGLFFLNRREKKTAIQHNVFQNVSGWGYDILVDGKLFIRQESIPALSGNSGFANKEQAEATARLIINKMNRGEEPTVTTFEIGLICQPKNKEDVRESRDR